MHIQTPLCISVVCPLHTYQGPSEGETPFVHPYPLLLIHQGPSEEVVAAQAAEAAEFRPCSYRQALTYLMAQVRGGGGRGGAFRISALHICLNCR